MTYLSAAHTDWPAAVMYLGVLFGVIFLITCAVAAFVVTRNAKLVANQEDDLRRLVHRYEQLAENTLDAQQRTATDVSELRSRTASIEQILRTVD
jgi:glucan phosphoethanolaminetransferase (alkaline phosphatase superfamily)